MEAISKEELDERVAIIKRFRALLAEERKKFETYLHALECHERSIENEDADSLLAHTELEQTIIEGISNMQKVIVPMSVLYNEKNKTEDGSCAAQDEIVSKLENDLSKLQKKVLLQNEKNRNLLRLHIARIQNQMQALRNPYRANKSVYAHTEKVGTLVEVQA